MQHKQGSKQAHHATYWLRVHSLAALASVSEESENSPTECPRDSESTLPHFKCTFIPAPGSSKGGIPPPPFHSKHGEYMYPHTMIFCMFAPDMNMHYAFA